MSSLYLHVASPWQPAHSDEKLILCPHLTQIICILFRFIQLFVRNLFQIRKLLIEAIEASMDCCCRRWTHGMVYHVPFDIHRTLMRNLDYCKVDNIRRWWGVISLYSGFVDWMRIQLPKNIAKLCYRILSTLTPVSEFKTPWTSPILKSAKTRPPQIKHFTVSLWKFWGGVSGCWLMVNEVWF